MLQKTLIRPRMTSEERRAFIVETASRLFAEKGFRGTTTRELAAAAGVSEPVLYEHFKTKSDLYNAIIDAKTSCAVAEFEAMKADYLERKDDRGFLIELGMRTIEWYVVDPTFIRLLLFSNLEGHEMRELFHQRQAVKFFGAVAAYIEQRMQDGAFREADPRIAARAFVGMIGHYALTGILFQCGQFEKSHKDVVTEMADIFLNGLCRQREHE